MKWFFLSLALLTGCSLESQGDIADADETVETSEDGGNPETSQFETVPNAGGDDDDDGGDVVEDDDDDGAATTDDDDDDGGSSNSDDDDDGGDTTTSGGSGVFVEFCYDVDWSGNDCEDWVDSGNSVRDDYEEDFDDDLDQSCDLAGDAYDVKIWTERAGDDEPFIEDSNSFDSFCNDVELDAGDDLTFNGSFYAPADQVPDIGQDTKTVNGETYREWYICANWGGSPASVGTVEIDGTKYSYSYVSNGVGGYNCRIEP